MTRTTIWADNQVLTAAALNAEFNNLLNAPAIVNADISAAAGITFSKLDAATVAGVTASQSLSNKTLTSPTITGTVAGAAAYTKPTLNASIQAITADSDGATITFDLSASNVHSVTLGGNRTLALSNDAVGQFFILHLIQDGSGNHTVTWFSTIKWVNGVAPTLSTAASAIDTFGFFVASTGVYYGYIVGQALA